MLAAPPHGDCGADVVTLAADSSAAKGFTSRCGLSRIRHIATRYLWLQERVARKEIKFLKIATEVNRGDAFTKPLAGARLDKLCGMMGLVYRAGRAASQKDVLLA